MSGTVVAPGPGAGVVHVYKFRGLFLASDDVGTYGPYEGFTEAAEAVALLTRIPRMTSGLAKDTSQHKFFVNAVYEGGVYVRIWEPDHIEKAWPIVKQARELARA